MDTDTTSHIPQDSDHVQVPLDQSIVTTLLLTDDKVVAASDNHSISIYPLPPRNHNDGRILKGHEGGIWCMALTPDGKRIVSGSTDRTVRIWDIDSGKCTHIFGGHTSSVRCLAVVEPEDGDGSPLIVTGSRDRSLRVWALPTSTDAEYKVELDDSDETQVDATLNPYHEFHLEGHEHAIRALAASGRTAVSGSYDCTVRIWDLTAGQIQWVLRGHTIRVYTVALDTVRHEAYSGGMDGTIRIWDLLTGTCKHVLVGHDSLIGQLSFSPSYLVSASTDATLCVWDRSTGQLLRELTGHRGAITGFQHDEVKVLSGADGALKLWDIKNGQVVKDLVTDNVGVWQVAFRGRWCVAANSIRTPGCDEKTVLDVWNFGEEKWF